MASNADRVRVAERRAKAVQLRIRGWDWQAIADELGYKGRGQACNDVTRARQQAEKHVRESVDQLRALELERIDALIRIEWEILEKPHLLVQGGKVVRVEVNGQRIALHDEGPKQAAVDRIIKLVDQRCRLLGINAPIQVEQQGSITYRFEGMDLEKL